MRFGTWTGAYRQRRCGLPHDRLGSRSGFERIVYVPVASNLGLALRLLGLPCPALRQRLFGNHRRELRVVVLALALVVAAEAWVRGRERRRGRGARRASALPLPRHRP